MGCSCCMFMFRATTVDYSILVLLYSISSGALDSPDVLLSYSITELALHITIILITPTSSNQPYPKSTDKLIN